MNKSTALQQCPLFRGVDVDVRNKLAGLFQERNLAAGDVLFREGDAASDLYVVAEGTIDIVKGQREGVEGGKLLSHIVPPGSIGEAALYGDRPRSATALARESSKVFLLPRAAFQQFTGEDPHSAQQIFLAASRVLFERLEHTSQELTAVYDLGKLLGEAPPLSQLARELVERVRLFVPQADQVAFYLWNQFSEEFEAAGAWSRGAASEFPALTSDHALVRAILDARQTVAREDPASSPAQFILASPLVANGKTIGFLSMSRQGTAFGNEQRNLLEAVCGMMVGAVMSAWAREEEKARQRLLQSKQRL